MAKKSTKKQTPVKPSAKKRTLNPTTPARSKKAGSPSSPFAEQDPKRRIGTFEGKGEPPLRVQRGGARKG